MSELRVETRDLEGGVSVLALDGVLDKRGTGALEQRIRELIEAGKCRLVVNCERLSHMSSDGMSVFLSQLIKIKKAGGDIKFAGMTPEVKNVLSVLGLNKLLTVKASEREAVAEFNQAASRQKPKEAEKLRVDVIEDGKAAVVALFGFVDRHTIALLDGALAGLLEKGKANIIIDCAELTYISSNGMGVFISYVNKARNMGGDIRFCNMRDIARTVITMLGLHRLFEVYDDRDGAVESFAG